MCKGYHSYLFYFALFVITGLTSCEVINPAEEIPSYISIDTIDLTTSGFEGSASHKITDAWVYVDNQLVGVFELPTRFPVLASGNSTVDVRAGVKENGISSTRIWYPFYEIQSYQVELTAGEIDTIAPVVHYYSTANFALMADFEDGGIPFEKTSRSDTTLNKTSADTSVFEGGYSGYAFMTSDMDLFECSAIEGLDLPKGGTPVYLEMNYKTNNIVNVGMYVTIPGSVVQESVVVLNHSKQWNKIYINLTTLVSYYTTATEYKLFFGIMKEDDVDEVHFYVDNIKLIHR